MHRLIGVFLMLMQTHWFMHSLKLAFVVRLAAQYLPHYAEAVFYSHSIVAGGLLLMS